MKNRIRKLSEIIAERKKAFFCAVKNVPALFALLLSLAALFSACQNSSGFDDGFFCIVNGSVYSKDGAESSSSETSARFAMPEPGNLYYTVKGTKDGGTETSDGVFLSDSSGKQEKTFTIKLTEGNWTLNASAYNENSSSLADIVKDENKVLEGSVKITVTKESPVITGTSIPLSPYYGTGSASGSKPTGKISLEISIDSSTNIKGVKTEWTYLDGGSGSSGSGSVTGVPQGKSIEVSSSAVSSTLKIEENNVPVGAYRLSLYFYSNYSNQATGTLLYYAQEDVNVMNGQTTSVWKATTENAPYLKDENGKTGFKVSADTIKDFRDTVFYVSGTGGYSPKKAASDENQGTYFDPLQTFTQAVSRIKERQKSASLSSAMTYTVYVSGEVSSAADFSDFFAGSSSSSATVNIESFSGTNGNKGTLKNLDGTAARTITTGSLTEKSLYLNFKDLSLSVSGNNNQDGSVINIERGVRVTLDSCTIKDNKVDSKGAVYVNKNNGENVDDRAFVVKGATKISGNTTSSNQPANVYLSADSIIVLDLPTSASQDNINIGVTTEKKPTVSIPVQITSSSLGVKASAFTSDEGYTVVKNTGGDNATTNRLELCVSGGTLSAKSIPVIKFEFANTGEGQYYTSKTEATVKKSEIGSGTGKKSKIGVSADGASGDKTVSDWNMEIYFHGIKVNTTSASASTDSITSVNLDSKWPAGEYQVFVTGTYDGIKYSSVLKLEITDN